MMTRVGVLVVIFLWIGSPVHGRKNDTWVEDTNLYVVLVKFGSDLPHGWVAGSPPTPGDDAYTMEDFERLFGVEDAPGFGETDTQSVADGNEPLPELYGSIKDYFDHLSGGEYDLTIKILNPEDSEGYPKWLTINRAKSHYLNLFHPDRQFYEHSIEKLEMMMPRWYPGDHLDYVIPGLLPHPPTTGTPSPGTPAQRRTNKVAFVYAGFTSAKDANFTALHPRAESVSSPTPRSGTGVASYATWYQTGARQGDGLGGTDPAEKFSGIGIHIHEIGHILGLSHGRGRSNVTNPYTTVNRTRGTANFLSWGPMSSNSQGPHSQGSEHPTDADYAYLYQFQSCPAPYNPAYMKFLGWGDHHRITRTQSQPFLPSPDDYYYIEGENDSRYHFDFRSADDFGHYVLSHAFEDAPGLMIWKHRQEPPSAYISATAPRVIPADGRSIYNALPNTKSGATVKEFSSTATYAWLDLLSDPFGALPDNGSEQTIRALPHSVDNPTELPSVLTYRNPEHRWTPDWATDASLFRQRNSAGQDRPSHVAVRNIHILRDEEGSGSAVANVYKNYQEGPLHEDMVEWSGDVYVGADVTIGEDQTLDIADDAVVHFLAPRSAGPTSEHPHGVDPNGTNITELIVQDSGTLNIGRNVTFRSMREEYTDSDGDRVEQDDVDPEGHGLIVESGGEVTIQGLTITDGDHYLYSEGEVTLAGDLRISGKHSSLNLRRSPSTADAADEAVTIKIASGDAAMDGRDETKVEIIVDGAKWKGQTLVEAAELNALNDTFEPADDNTSGWQGIEINANSGGRVHLTGATLKEGDWCLRVPYPEHVTLGNATFTNYGLMKPVGDHDVREFEKLGDDYWTAGYKVRSSVTGPKDSPASVAWSLSGDDAGQLEIHAGSGVLTFADPGADFEARSDRVYTATVQAIVGPPAVPLATVEQDVKITVLDVPAPDAPAVTLDPDSGRETAGATVTLDNDQGMRVRQVLARLSSVPAEDPDGTRQWHPLGRPNAPGAPSEADGYYETSIAYTNDNTYESWKESGTAYEWSVSPNRTYRFEAKLENLEGESEVGSVSYTPPPRDPLTISGPSTPFYYIDWTAPIGTYKEWPRVVSVHYTFDTNDSHIPHLAGSAGARRWQ